MSICTRQNVNCLQEKIYGLEETDIFYKVEIHLHMSKQICFNHSVQ